MRVKKEEYIKQEVKVKEFAIYDRIEVEDYIQNQIRVEDSKTNG